MVSQPKNQTPSIWEAASVYFLMTDRFNNGDNKQNASELQNSPKLAANCVVFKVVTSKEFRKRMRGIF
jgi:hypothetical protein